MKMKIYLYTIKISLIFIFISFDLKALNDKDSNNILNMDAVYNRPLIKLDNQSIAIGGYVETNTQYSIKNGISEGFSFQAKRLTLFFSSTIAKQLKFLSEIEFESGGKEINIEFAALDLEFDPSINLRGGIFVNPIGAFNQNHDGPKWDFIDRPLSATKIIPSTLSNVGFGIYGKYFVSNWVLGYETYLSNGFDDKIIYNEENRTSLSAGKANPFKFEESFSGTPMFTGKIALRNRNYGEIGISYLKGVYNKWQNDGIILDKKRKVSILALDFNTTLIENKLNINGEVAKVFVELQEGVAPQFGNEQFGFYSDIIYNIYKGRVLNWENAKISLGIRCEFVDFNVGEFYETKTKIFDEIWSITPTFSFRPVGSSVIKLNYKYEINYDILGNLPKKIGSIQFGFSTYF